MPAPTKTLSRGDTLRLQSERDGLTPDVLWTVVQTTERYNRTRRVLLEADNQPRRHIDLDGEVHVHEWNGEACQVA